MKNLILASLLLAASACFGQSYTTVSATITDANGTTYANGRFNARLNVVGHQQITTTDGNILVNPGPAAIPYDSLNGISGPLDNAGAFSVQLAPNAMLLPAGTQWKFTICAADASTCFTSLQTVTGVTQNLTSALSAVAVPYYDVRANALHVGPGGATFNDNTRQTTAGGGGGGGAGLGDPGSNGIVKRTALNVTSTSGSPDVIALWTGSCSSTTYLAGDGSCSVPVGTLALADPGSNGILKRTGLNITAVVAGADVIGLFSGSCSSSTFLRGDGTCATPSGSGNLADPGSNGVIKRTALNVTAAAGNTDVIALWTGSCSSSTYLRGDGSCQTPSGSGNLADPGANGVVKRTSLNVTAAAAASDLTSLFSGSCTSSSFLRGDGACAAPPTGALADPGSNGVMKRTALNTTAAAAVADLTALFSGSCSSSNFLRGDGACSAPSGTLPGVIKVMSSYASATAALAAMNAGDTMIVDGTYSLCNGALNDANVVLKGSGSLSGILQCATANQPVLIVSGDGAQVINTKEKHITNSPTAGGDGIFVNGGTTNVRIIDNEVDKNYNGINLGNTSFGIVSGNYIAGNNNAGVIFTADGTSQVMQWRMYNNISLQNLGPGFDFTLGGAISGLQITCPTWLGNTAYGNNSYGFKISASAATTSGISDCFFGGENFASFNNNSGFYLDAGPNGGRNNHWIGGFSELSGQTANTAGFSNGSLTPSGVGYGLEITSSCDPTIAPQVTGMMFWQNSYSGAISACTGTQFSDINAYKNGLSATGNSYQRAAVAVRASNISVLGGYFRDNSSKQIYGVDISNSADKLILQVNCETSVGTCIQQSTVPTSLLTILPTGVSTTGSFVTTGTAGTGTVRSTWLLGDQGTAQTSGNITITGWGSGAAKSAVTGYAQRFEFTVTAGTTPSANPTVVATFPDTAPIAPICYARQTGGNDVISDLTSGTESTTSTGTLTWIGTPTNTKTYSILVDCR